MGDQKSPETQHRIDPQDDTHKSEKQCKGHTGDDLRVGHGDIGHGHNGLAESATGLVDAQRGHGAENCGRKGRDHSNDQGVAQQCQQEIVPEEFGVLMEGEAFKIGNILAGALTLLITIYFIYVFNTEKKVFSDKNVRRALSLALDRAAIEEAVTFGKAATGFLPDSVLDPDTGKSFNKNEDNLISTFDFVNQLD